jgi:hypothetical protein
MYCDIALRHQDVSGQRVRDIPQLRSTPPSVRMTFGRSDTILSIRSCHNCSSWHRHNQMHQKMGVWIEDVDWLEPMILSIYFTTDAHADSNDCQLRI